MTQPNHPLYPEPVLVPCCPDCQSEEMHDIRGKLFCAACSRRAEQDLQDFRTHDIDFQIKESKYSGSIYANNMKYRDYWYD